jgi:hypothetical protein
MLPHSFSLQLSPLFLYSPHLYSDFCSICCSPPPSLSLFAVGGNVWKVVGGGDRQLTLTQSSRLHSFPDTSVTCYFRNSRLLPSYVTTVSPLSVISKYSYFLKFILCLRHLWGHIIPCGSNACAQRDLLFGDFGAHRFLKIESANSLMITHHQRYFRHKTVRKLWRLEDHGICVGDVTILFTNGETLEPG